MSDVTREADFDKKSRDSSRRRKRDRLKEFASKCKRMVTNTSSKPEAPAAKACKTEDVPPVGTWSSESAGMDSDSNEKPVPAVTPEATASSLEQKMDCRPSICLIPLKDHADLGLSLSGCGFLSVYHFGVVKCFLRNGKPLVSRLRRVSGASAGSLVAAMLVLAPDELDRSMETMCEMADELNTLKFGALSPGFYIAERLVKIVDEYMPRDVMKANNRLFISLTHHKTRENRLISSYPDRDYLIKCLNASCYIPMYSMGLTAPPPEVDGEPYCDGGYSNNLPDYSDLRTITVSPFASKADITPADEVGFDWKMTLGNQHMKVNLRNIVRGAQSLFPPSRATLKHYYDQGYRDAFKFLMDNGMLERDSGSSV